MKRTTIQQRVLSAEDGPITLDGLRWLVAEADKLKLSDQAVVEIRSGGPRGNPSITVTDQAEAE